MEVWGCRGIQYDVIKGGEQTGVLTAIIVERIITEYTRNAGCWTSPRQSKLSKIR
ncbi:hypothetical protein [Ureibacillus sinduriensis]|uniref:hypothetical protein n=1 Tax=Ureibacillus sinduriensis TaxID=561440 RepID=UPI0012EC5805|nr:hypothetical protein [Ureibacillus sinduriensis]